MNIQQFAALKVGDKVDNPMNGSRGEVTKVQERGVSVAWGGNALDFYYPVEGNTWLHWELVPAEPTS
jgi:hypothetical protein